MRPHSDPRGPRSSLVQIRASWIHGSQRRPFCIVALAALIALASLGCIGSAEDEPLAPATGKEADVTHDGLVRMTGSALEGVWVKPGADIAGYRELLVAQTRVAYKRKPGASQADVFPLTSSEIEVLENLFYETFVKEVEKSQDWTLAKKPGPAVLLVEPFLYDLEVTAPTVTESTETVYTTSAGSVTLVLELRDSLSEEILARVADRSEARATGSGGNLALSNPVTNAEAARLVFKRWSRILMARLDTARRLHPNAPLADGGAPAASAETGAAPAAGSGKTSP